jgi:uncharacterized damage-inducible protein DinB
MKGLQEQYDWVRRTRELLFTYCETLSPEDYTRPIESFGGSTITDLHAHVAECYGFWLGRFSIEGSSGLGPFEKPKTVAAMRDLFQKADVCVATFFQTFADRWDIPISGHVHWQPEPFVVTPLWLYTHAMTHEFHHKGQIASMSRALGYIPVDTDLIAPGHKG